MAETKETLKLDLDSKEFMSKVMEATHALQEMTDVESVSQLVGVLKGGAIALSAVAAAALAAKTALDLTLEAESIKKVNDQFEMLSRNAGISASELKEGLEKAANGLIDTDELLQSANKAIVTMGGSARQLPSIFEVARNATKVFGGELTANFEQLNQAIATGQTRALRSLGIVIDSDVAYIKYAKSIGVTVQALSDAEKKQAILNEVLSKGKTTFADMGGKTDSVAASLKKASVAFSEMRQTFVLFFDKVFGPTVARAVTLFKEFAELSKTVALRFFGDEADKAGIKLKGFETAAKNAQSQIEYFTERLKTAKDPKQITSLNKAIEHQKQLLSDAQTEIAKYQEKIAALKPAEALEPSVDPAKAAIEQAKRLEVKSKFEESLQQLTLNRIKSEEQVATSIEEVDMLSGEKIVAMRELRDARLRELDAQVAIGQIQGGEELALRRQEIEATTAAEIVRIQQDADQKRIESLHRFAEFNKSTMAGFAGSVKAASASAGQDFANFSKTGQQFMGSFKNNAVAAFKSIGDGSKTAGEAMRGFMLGAIADMAEAKGSELLLSGVWPPNPLALGAGAALIALSGFLRSKSQGASGGLGAQAAATGGGAGLAGGTSPVIAQEAPQLPETKKREVSINIMGHYMETPESRRWLTEMLRQESDATQFTIAQIGQGAT